MKRHLMLVLLALCSATSLLAQSQDADFGFSYTLLPKGNQTSIVPDGTIAFPDALVNPANPTQGQTNSATFVVTNRSTRVLAVNNITAVGGVFKVSSVPLL